jgi:DNA invertase Pin-like site-specific DNA recombinase
MQHMNQHYVAYFRVSTLKQGRTGLGLEAQRTVVDAYLRGRGELIAHFTDIESGKKAGRPQLQTAIQFCKQHNAILLIAKLDRLTRNVSFVFTLRDSDIEFVCADMPEANTLTIGVMATMAQYEREIIGDRTRKALAERKKQGIKLGKPDNLTDSAITKSRLIRQDNARHHENNRKAGILAHSLRKMGKNWSQIAETLNKHGFVTRRGKTFQAIQVQRVVKLMED